MKIIFFDEKKKLRKKFHSSRKVMNFQKIKKTYMQGYCYPCFIESPKTSECILKPELCRAHEGEARDMEWAKEHCLQNQYVYLSLTSNLKVGVTRYTQIPTRWIDQGAHEALIFAKTPNRYTAGVIEKILSQHISDRTYWRRMLLGEYPNLDLIDEKKKLSEINIGEYSLQCGRRVDSLKLWLTWKYLGDIGFEKHMDHLFGMAKYAEEKIKSSEELVLIPPVNYLNLCFQVKPKGLATEQVDEFTVAIRHKLLDKGKAMVNYAKVDNKSCIRLVTVNPDLTTEHLDTFFRNIEDMSILLLKEVY